MTVNETEMLNILSSSNKVTLLEPPYKRKYPPLGLAKIHSYVGSGKEVVYQRDYQPWGDDLVCVTSLFTFDSQKVLEAISQIRLLNPSATILVGGIFASLMPKSIEVRYPDVKVFVGYSKRLDKCPPRDFDWNVDDPWGTYSYIFTSRGCPNSCAYCAVNKIEPDTWINPTWKEHIDLDKPNVMLSDNNLSAQPLEHLTEVCNFIAYHKKRVVFDNGFDCKLITPELAKLLAGLKYTRSGLRLAFDRIEEDGIFQKAIELLREAGVAKGSLMAYVLFNFNDKPLDAIYRMEECIRLGVRPYPQQYSPLNRLDRKNSYIGKHWTKNLAKSFRFFHLMAGYYGKERFVDWVQSDRAEKSGYRLDEEDWTKLQIRGFNDNQQRTMVMNRKEGIKRETDIAPAISAPDWRGLNRNQDQPVILHNIYGGFNEKE